MNEGMLIGSLMNDTIRVILNLIGSGKYLITKHAQSRMGERRISHADIRNCGKTGIALESEGKIRVRGLDCDGESLVIVCVNDNGVIVITVF